MMDARVVDPSTRVVAVVKLIILGVTVCSSSKRFAVMAYHSILVVQSLVLTLEIVYC